MHTGDHLQLSTISSMEHRFALTLCSYVPMDHSHESVLFLSSFNPALRRQPHEENARQPSKATTDQVSLKPPWACCGICTSWRASPLDSITAPPHVSFSTFVSRRSLLYPNCSSNSAYFFKEDPVLIPREGLIRRCDTMLSFRNIYIFICNQVISKSESSWAWCHLPST